METLPYCHVRKNFIKFAIAVTLITESNGRSREVPILTTTAAFALMATTATAKRCVSITGCLDYIDESLRKV